MRHTVRGVLTAVAAMVSVVLATVGLTGEARAAVVPGTLVVVLTDSVGAPLGEATVEAITGGSVSRITTLSQPLGAYQLTVLPVNYQIRITDAGSGFVDYVPGSPTIDRASRSPS
jgi:hypothetical protein